MVVIFLLLLFVLSQPLRLQLAQLRQAFGDPRFISLVGRFIKYRAKQVGR